MSKSFWHCRLSISRKRCQLSEVEGLGIIHVLEPLPCESKAHTYTPTHTHLIACIFIARLSFFLKCLCFFSQFRRLSGVFAQFAFEVWGNLHKSLGESQYFLVMPTCCSPARLLGPCAYLMEVLNYRLTMGLSFLHWPQHSGTHWTMEQRNTSAKPNLCRAEGYRGAWPGPALPWGYFAQRP